MTWTADQPDRRTSGEYVSWKAYVDSLFDGGIRAIEVAERERKEAAGVLRTTQERAQDVAERERERAAQALAQTLTMAFQEAIERLREHIVNQSRTFDAALGAVEGRALLRQEASDKAVQKAENAQNEVNKTGNEYRGQLREQHAQMIPRPEAEKVFESLIERIRVLEAAGQLQIGINTANTRTEDRSQSWQIWAAGAFLTILFFVVSTIIGIGAFT